MFHMANPSVFRDDKQIRLIKHRRKQNWTNPTEMEAFLSLLEENCEELSYLKRNLSLYFKMSYKMASLGFRREPLELRKKVSNIICKYKQEKAQGSTDWPYFERVEEILTKMKKYNHTGFVSDRQPKIEESSPEKSRNETQKIVLIKSGSSNVCIDEADMETILKAMNGEDFSDRNDESSSALEIADASNRLPDSDHPEDEEDDDDSRSNDMTIDTSNQSLLTTVPINALENHKMSDPCTASTLAIKMTDDQDLPKIKKNVPIVKNAVKKTQKVEPCTKDEVDLYAALLATRLRSMDEKSRHIAMNKIDNMLFKMKMDEFEGQLRSQNLGTPHKSQLSLILNAKEML